MHLCVHVVFFFKQKPAYEMRISDWSSDVCSSDLEPRTKSRSKSRRGRSPDLRDPSLMPVRDAHASARRSGLRPRHPRRIQSRCADGERVRSANQSPNQEPSETERAPTRYSAHPRAQISLVAPSVGETPPQPAPYPKPSPPQFKLHTPAQNSQPKNAT